MPETPKDSHSEYLRPRGEHPLTFIFADPLGALANRLAPILSQDEYFEKVRIRYVKKPAELLAQTKNQSASILVLADRQLTPWFECLELVRHLHPEIVMMLAIENWDHDSLRKSVNQLHGFRHLALQFKPEEMLYHLHTAGIEAELAFSQMRLMREASKQNRELEDLTQDLEEVVAERTKHIEISKEATDAKLDQARHLSRLFKELAQNISFEEIMSLVRFELRRFAKVGDPILLLKWDEKKTEVLSFRSGILQETKVKKSIVFPKQDQLNDKNLSLDLANVLGRPFIQVMAFPLDIQLIRKYGHQQAAALLCFESNLSEAEQGLFLQHFKEVLKPVAMAVDRSFLEREMMMHSLRWEKTFDGLRDPVGVIDAQYQVLRANSKFSDRVVQKKCYAAFAGRDTPCVGCPQAEVLATGQKRVGQVQVGPKMYEVHSYPIEIPGTQKIATVVNQYIDVTQAREIYARMLQSEKLSALGMLAGNIAHELNNPLSGLRNLTQILISEVQTHKQEWQTWATLEPDLQEVEKAAARSQKIIRNLLDFSGEGDHSTVAISLAEVLERTLPLLKMTLRQHRLQLQLDAKDVTVQVDVHLMQQVVFNLINNACHAMDETGSLQIQTGVDSARNVAFLSVQDSGPGIALDLQEKVFEAFFTTKGEGQGTGLGLSLSRDIVRRYGGEIELFSIPGKGAKFTVIMPMPKDQSKKSAGKGVSV